MNKRDNSGGSLSSELHRASTDFKSSPGHREASARKLLPHIVAGMTIEQVIALLGEPTDKGSDGLFWRYSVFYSKTIEVYFNQKREVVKVVPIGIAEEQ